MPVKSLSDSYSGNQSISSRATSRRSKSIVSTPEEQRLFENISSSLAVGTPTSAKNKLKRFQQKKEMALASPSDPKKMIHPTQQASLQDRSIKQESETERYFSLGGSLAIDRPGKVTPILYKIPTSLSTWDGSWEDTGTTYTYESEGFAPLPELNHTETDEDAFTDLETKRLPTTRSKAIVSGYQEGDDESSTVNVSTAGCSATKQDKAALLDGTKSQTSLSLKNLKSLFKLDKVFSTDDEVSSDDGHISAHLSEIGCVTSASNQEDSTLSQSTMTSTIATMDQSIADQSAVVDQPCTDQCSTRQEYSLLGLTSSFNNSATGQETTPSNGQSTVLSIARSSGATSVGRSTAKSSQASSSGTSRNNKNHNIASRPSQSDSIVHIPTRSFDTSSSNRSGMLQSVRSVETNFEDRGTAKSVESIFGIKMVKNQNSKPSVLSHEVEKGGEGTVEEEKEVFGPISGSGSDVSDITTLSRAQRHVPSIPVMNYSNIFSTGSTSIWSRNENLKRDDEIFMSRAQTLLDFYEARLNADKTELLLIPGDKKVIDSKFNVSTRLRFVDSLRMRCVVKNEKTEKIVQRCCRIGLDKEGAHNPIFATGALGNRKITVKMPKPVVPKKEDQLEKSKTETDSVTVSPLSWGTAGWDESEKGNKGRKPTVIEPDCSALMCGISLLVC